MSQHKRDRSRFSKEMCFQRRRPGAAYPSATPTLRAAGLVATCQRRPACLASEPTAAAAASAGGPPSGQLPRVCSGANLQTPFSFHARAWEQC